MNLRHLSGATGLALLFAFWVPPASAEIRIGIAAPLSGSVALSGEQQDLGARRAVADINKAGGILGQTVSVISVDDACDAKQAVAVAKQLVSANVNVVIGHLCSATSINASEIYDAAGTVMISPASTNPAVTDRGLKTVFRVIGRDDDQAEVAANFILKKFADKRIAVLHDGDTYGKGLATGVKNALNAAGKQEILFDFFVRGQKGYSEVVGKIVEINAEIVYIVSNSVNDAALLTLQIKSKLPNSVIISADAIASDGFSLVAREAGTGTYFTFGPDARLLPTAKEVVESMRDEDAYDPAGYTLYSYAAVQSWAGAVAAAGTTKSDAVISALHTEKFETVLGTIGFNSKGDVTGVGSFVMYQWGPENYKQID